MPGDRPSMFDRPQRELMAILLIAVVTAMVLQLCGKSSLRYAPAPMVRTLSASHDAFPLWYQERLRGRTLVLFARYLRAERQEDDETSFRREDFEGIGQFEAFCSVLHRDRIIGPAEVCSVDILDELLRSPNLYDRLAETQQLVLPRPVHRLLRMSQGYIPDYWRMPASQQNRLRTLNRSLLELAYPGICPKHLRYGLTPDNYVFLGIKHRVIRRVYHVIPDDEWAEVSANLERIPHVVRLETGYRITIQEGVPVVVVRLGDLPAITETVIAHVNTDVWQPQELDAMQARFRAPGIRSDVLTASGVLAERFLREVRHDQ